MGPAYDGPVPLPSGTAHRRVPRATLTLPFRARGDRGRATRSPACFRRVMKAPALPLFCPDLHNTPPTIAHSSRDRMFARCAVWVAGRDRRPTAGRPGSAPRISVPSARNWVDQLYVDPALHRRGPGRASCSRRRRRRQSAAAALGSSRRKPGRPSPSTRRKAFKPGAPGPMDTNKRKNASPDALLRLGGGFSGAGRPSAPHRQPEPGGRTGAARRRTAAASCRPRQPGATIRVERVADPQRGQTRPLQRRFNEDSGAAGFTQQG